MRTSQVGRNTSRFSHFSSFEQITTVQKNKAGPSGNFDTFRPQFVFLHRGSYGFSYINDIYCANYGQAGCAWELVDLGESLSAEATSVYGRWTGAHLPSIPVATTGVSTRFIEGARRHDEIETNEQTRQAASPPLFP